MYISELTIDGVVVKFSQGKNFLVGGNHDFVFRALDTLCKAASGECIDKCNIECSVLDGEEKYIYQLTNNGTIDEVLNFSYGAKCLPILSTTDNMLSPVRRLNCFFNDDNHSKEFYLFHYKKLHKSYIFNAKFDIDNAFTNAVAKLKMFFQNFKRCCNLEESLNELFVYCNGLDNCIDEFDFVSTVRQHEWEQIICSLNGYGLLDGGDYKEFLFYQNGTYSRLKYIGHSNNLRDVYLTLRKNKKSLN